MANRPVDKLDLIYIDYRTDLPAPLVAEIGRIAVEWSRLEAHFEETIRLLMPAEMFVGRIVTTGMNIRSRVLTACNLVKGYELHGMLKESMYVEITDIGNEITDGVKGADRDRNKFVHGLWARVEGQWELIRNSGTRTSDIVGKLPRPVLPQREAVSLERLTEARRRIRKINERMIVFCGKLEDALPPSPYKSRRQLRQNRPTRARRKKAA